MKKIFNFKKLQLGLMILYTSIIVSCSKFVEVADPIDQLTKDFVFSDSTSTEGTVVGIYSNAGSLYGFLAKNITLYSGLSADEFVNYTPNSEYDVYANNELTSQNIFYWYYPYNVIYSCNTVIQSLSNSSITETQKNRLIGECKFMRALNYFYLVNLFGGVPLAVTDDYKINRLLPRADTTIIYNQIVSDLQDAKSKLSTTYVGSDKTRANKCAATALLARVYLYRKDYTNAAKEASEIINTGTYSLSNLSNVFLFNSSEAIFQFTAPTNQSSVTSDASSFVPYSSTTYPTFLIRDGLLGAFESGDQRRSNWIKSSTISGKTYSYPYKYKIYSVTTGSSMPEGTVLLRLAELYLIRAEALAQQNDLVNAIKDLDVIRNRAGLSLIGTTAPSINKQALLDTIDHENRIEFFAECGHRWLDLKRLGKADAVLGALKPATWQTTDQLYPIGSDILLADPNVTQNPGYTQ
ncbi:MAG: RagB/SusD family nutrient uptake outer membrane protein [Arachidicoccus sp.]|nr:RagB/SusD family nutrient uptake outer membrane protein [Arachidicoccus sp.]